MFKLLLILKLTFNEGNYFLKYSYLEQVISLNFIEFLMKVTSFYFLFYLYHYIEELHDQLLNSRIKYLIGQLVNNLIIFNYQY